MKVEYVAENGILLAIEKDGISCDIAFELIEKIWPCLNEESFEYGKAYIWDDKYIAFSAVVASGQGGAFFVWDIEKNGICSLFKSIISC